jgi:5-carboxymethyl-2-hydroxymuconate isomerase
MPHLTLSYSANLESQVAFTPLCRALADCMVAAKDEANQNVFPTGGVRVLAYPAAHSAVSDGTRDATLGADAFLYLHLNMKAGRSAGTHKAVGDALMDIVKVHLADVFAKRHIGVTLQITEGAEVHDTRWSNIHPLYRSKQPRDLTT